MSNIRSQDEKELKDLKASEKPLEKDLTSNMEDYGKIEELDETFDQDAEVLDDNMNQGMRIGRGGRPMEEH